ncbi:MAG: deoxyribonuclease IV [bacterium]
MMPGYTPTHPLLGAHMSIAGGVDQAILSGNRLRCEAIQIFVKSNVQWAMRPLDPKERNRFTAALGASGIKLVFAHSSYLINPAAVDRGILKKSIASLREELRRAAELGLPFVVLHPGSHGGAGVREGIKKVATSLDKALAGLPDGSPKILLETTAGQGTSIGWRFEQLAEIMAAVERSKMLGVCFDTCHVFAAGYDIRTASGYKSVMREFDGIVGLKKIKAFHLNDCKSGFGLRVDRHEHIGRGAIGKKAFSLLLNDPRFKGMPMVLETPKGKEGIWDRRNLGLLRRMLRLKK